MTEFARVLRRRHVLALAFGAMIGWSWVLMSGPWIARAGTLGAASAFLIAGIAMLFIALTYAELAAAMPEVGGEHVYTERAFGRGPAFVCAWALLLGYLSVVAFEVLALPWALRYVIGGLDHGRLWQVAGSDVYASHIVLGLLCAAALTVLNVRGMARAATFQNLVTIVIVVAGMALLIGAVRSGAERNLEPWFADGARGVAAVMIMVPLMFVGFDVVPQAAAEIDLPPRTIGRLMLVSVLCAIVWYAGVIVAVGYVLDLAARSASTLATADAARAAWSGSWASHVLIVGGIAGILTSWNAFLVGASRLMHAVALAGMAPAWLLGGRSSASVPVRSLWIICGLSCLAPWFGRPALVWLLNAGSLAIVIAYALVALAFVRLRRREPHMPRPYRVPGGATVGWIAFGLSLGLGALYLPWSPSALTLPEWVVCGVWLIAGLLIYRLAPARRVGAHRAAVS